MRFPKKKKVKVAANVIKRILAFIIDIAIIGIILSPLSGLVKLNGSFAENLSALEAQADFFGFISFMMGLFGLLYFSVLEYKLEQTVGKMLTNLYVISEQKKLTFLQCILRNLFILPFIPFVLLWVVDPIYYLFAGKRFSDMMSRTTVEEYVLV